MDSTCSFLNLNLTGSIIITNASSHYLIHSNSVALFDGPLTCQHATSQLSNVSAMLQLVSSSSIPGDWKSLTHLNI